MRTYLHIYPTCPSCHEPHRADYPLKHEATYNKAGMDCILTCTFPGCNTTFRTRIRLRDCTGFRSVLESLGREWSAPVVQEKLSGIPLAWEIKPNAVEESYLQWLNEADGVKALVTWPWEEVKFIPLLAAEYLQNHPFKKAVVVGAISPDEVKELSDRSKIAAPGAKGTFDSLICVEDDPAAGKTAHPAGRLDGKDVFIEVKKKFFRYTITYPDKTRYVSDPEPGKKSLEKYIETTLSRIEQDAEEAGYPCDKLIKKIVVKKAGKKDGKYRPQKEEVLNKSGILTICFEMFWKSSAKLNYDPEWITRILLNTKGSKRVCKAVPTAVIEGKEDKTRSNGNARLFFISSEADAEEIFRIVKQISPDLVIIQDADYFISDRYYYDHRKSSALCRFLKNQQGTSVIMFSTNREARYRYGINQEDNWFIREGNVTPHTWDAEILLDKIRKIYGYGSKYPNPASSGWEERPTGGKNPDTEFVTVRGLEPLDDFLTDLQHLHLDNADVEDITLYIRSLKRSLLLPRRDGGNGRVFSCRGRHSEYVTYDTIAALVEKNSGMEEIRRVEELFNRVYGERSDNAASLLLTEVTNKAAKLLEKEGTYVTVITYRPEADEVSMLLRGRGLDKHMDSRRLAVCCWGDLSERETEITDGTRHYVISTVPPSDQYRLYFSCVHRFVFLGTSENLEEIRRIINNRIAEIKSRPVYLLSDSDPAPKLLKETLKEIPVSRKELAELCSEIEFDEPAGTPKPTMISAGGRLVIRAGESVVLVTDHDGNCMFLPRNASVLVQAENKPKVIYLGDVRADKLQDTLGNREIIADKNGIFTSFKPIFIRFMISKGGSLRFQCGPCHWNGFLQLYMSATCWIRTLDETVRRYSEKKGISYTQAEKEISEELGRLGLSAEDPNYIRRWWEDYETVETDQGVYPVYITEHPKGRDDIEKIYSGIKKLLPEMPLDPENGRCTYLAAITMQRIRRSMLEGEEEGKEPLVERLRPLLQAEMEDITKTSASFAVKTAREAKIAKEAVPFRIIQESECSEYL